MKKLFTFLIIIVIIIFAIGLRYNSYRTKLNSLVKENAEYEKYLDKEIYGIELATIINKTMDKNIKNEVTKDEKGIFIQNNDNSINLEIYMKDNETTYKMEQIYNQGTSQFVQYYGNIRFKCTKVEYHEQSQKVKYVLVEQL